MSEKVLLHSNEDMYDYFRQTPEYIFIDKVEVIPGISAVGEKNISKNEWYFKYHFPNDPIMPGVFQMEALMQTGGLIINTLPGKKDLKLYFGECKSIRINEGVRPGDTLSTIVELKQYRRGVAWFDARMVVGTKTTCKMKFSLISPEEVGEIMSKKES